MKPDIATYSCALSPKSYKSSVWASSNFAISDFFTLQIFNITSIPIDVHSVWQNQKLMSFKWNNFHR